LQNALLTQLSSR